MRVMLAVGRVDGAVAGQVRSMRRLAAGGGDVFMNSAVAADIAASGRARGWAVDTLRVGAAMRQEFAAPDVVVNLMSDPLACAAALDWLDRFARDTGLPVVNTVAATRRSARTALAAALAGIPGVRVPHTTRFTGPAGELPAHVERSGHRWPVLLRPPGAHGSEGLTLHADARVMLAEPDRPLDRVVSDFVDARGADGLYRKYRMIWVGGRLFRRHLIAASHWNITGAARRDMVGREALIQAEKAFIAGAEPDLDRRVAALFRAVGLDVAVIDFAQLASGELVVFELNGVFQISGSIPLDKQERWGYLESGNAALGAAMLDVIAAQAPRRIVYGVGPPS